MFVNFNILNQLGSPAINSNTFANRPAAGQTGRLFVSTDTYEIYRDNGTTWDLIGGPGSSTITGTGTATQVAYFTSSQAIGSSANLFWDNTNTRLGVGTAAPGYTIEANGSIKANSIYLTGAAGGSGALYWTSDRVTVANYNVGGIVLIETNGGPTAATFGADYTATFVSGIGTRGYTGSTSYGALFNGSVGINTATPGAALDVHSTGTIAQFNTTSATGNTYIAFQRTGSGLWRIGDTYNGGNNFFELHNTVLGTDALEFEAATNKSTFQAQQTYTTGLARGNYFDYNLSVAAGGSFSSPNAITALTATLDLTLAGNATIPSGARSGLDAYNTIAFTGAGTLTHSQGTQIRAYSNLTAGWAFNGSATGTITHLAGLRALFPDNSGSAVNVTNNYALLLNDQTANTGTVTYTNRWGVYQEGASDLNYMAANLLLGSTTNIGQKLQVTGTTYISGATSIGTTSVIGGYIFSVLGTGGSGARTATFGGPDSATSTGSTGPVVTIYNSNTTTNNIAKLAFAGYTTGEACSINAQITDQANNYGQFIFTTRDSSGYGDRMYLNSSGLGVDTNSITNKLVINGNNVGYDIQQLGTPRFRLEVGNNDTYLSTIGLYDMYLRTNQTSVLTLKASGNVLIGTTTDAGQKLQVNGEASINGLITQGGGIYAATGQFSQGGSATSTFYTFSNVSSNRVFLVTLRQSGAAGNSVIAMGFTYAGVLAAYNVAQDNTNPALYLTITSTGGLGLQLTTGAGYGTTTWDWTITQIK